MVGLGWGYMLMGLSCRAGQGPGLWGSGVEAGVTESRQLCSVAFLLVFPGMVRIGSIPNAKGKTPRLKVQEAFCLRRR